MTLEDVIDQVLDAWNRADASITCICGPEEDNPECPWFLDEEARGKMQLKKAAAIFRETNPKVAQVLESGNG